MKTTLKKILVPVDFSLASRHALKVACGLALEGDETLTLLNIYQIPGFVYPDGFMPAGPERMSDLMEKTNETLEALKQVAQRAGAKHVFVKACEGTPFAEIVSEAQAGNCDLIVMGTHGHTGITHAWLGSVAENVVRRASCPVMTVRLPTSDGGRA
jgi:nucleotide-binding universal stress UspA family protein